MPKILIIDDLPDNVTLLTFDLEDQGYDVIRAQSGPEGLELAAAQRPDAILLDVMMPEMDGIEVCRRLKADPQLAHIPVVLLTAKDQDRDIIGGLNAGADDYVIKPLNIRILLARLEVALRAKKAQDAIRRTNARLQAANELLEQRSKRLAELNDAAFEFVDNVSHDFRTPLSVIKEFASIISDGLGGEVTEDQREYLGIMSNSVDDLTLMVNDMLDISKLEAGLLSVRRTNCAVDDVVGRVRATLEQKAAVSKIDLTVALDPDLPAVYCDAAKIGRVVINLAVNAIKFAGEGAHITIWAQAEEQSSEVVIGVTDDGPGIDKDKLNLIFERFKQVGANPRASTKGVGLGLNIAKELVTLNFGQISVKSEPGKGSTFSFTLPTADPVKILRRYLQRPDSGRGDLDHVALVTAEVGEPCQGDLATDIDEFLQNVLRSTDLVLWVSPGCWMLVVQTDRDRGSKVIGRIEEAWQQANRNRPTGPLPKITMNLSGTWCMATQRDEFVANFQNELKVMEGACV